MWFGKQHKEALATLKYGVLDNEGFLLLTGDVGTGKTTLINALIQSLTNDIIYTTVPDPSLSRLDFFNYVASSFGIEQEFSTKGTFLAQFQRFLLDAHTNKKKVLLIIDESQLLTQELLEEIRLLSNIDKSNKKLINIFFVGQNELVEILRQEKNRAVRQRLTLNYSIGPLTPDETDKYIKHRLKVAGATHAIFKPEAVQEVFMYSGGFPRRINVICDHALLSGYVKESKTIGVNIVLESAKELNIPAYVKNRDTKGFENHTPKPIQTVQSQLKDLKTEQPEEKKKWTTGVLTGFIIILVFLSICWWVIVPISFQPEKDDNLKSTENITHQREKLYLPATGQNNFDKNRTSTAIEKPRENAASQTSNLNSTKKILTQTPLIQDELEKANEKDKSSTDEIQYQQTPSSKPAEKVSAESSNQLNKAKKILPLPEEKIMVRFKYNTNTITEEGHAELNNFADILIMHPDTKIFIAGYSDANGNQVYNVRLSESRASIIKSFLLGRGVNPGQIESKGFGSLNPVESNQTSWGRMMNRRVEINVLK